MSREAALIKVPAGFFARSPVEAQVALAQVDDAQEVLSRLLTGGHSSVAGRLAGAFRHVGRSDMTEEILEAMQGPGYDVRETNPFTNDVVLSSLAEVLAPISRRMRALWDAHRQVVIDTLPVAPGLPADTSDYVARVDEIYRTDAYHSLVESAFGEAADPTPVSRSPARFAKEPACDTPPTTVRTSPRSACHRRAPGHRRAGSTRCNARTTV